MFRTQILLLAIAVLPTVLYSIEGLMPPPGGKEALYYLILYTPFFFVGLTALLGLRLNQARLFLASLLLLLAYALLTKTPIPGSPPLPLREWTALLSIAIPLGLLLLFLNRESALLSPKGLSLTLLTFGPLAALLLGYELGIVEPYSLFPQAERLKPSFWNLPGLALGMVLLLFIQAALYRRTSIESFTFALLISLIPLFSALDAIAEEPAVTASTMRFLSLNFLALSIVLFFALFKIYWQRIYTDELTGLHNRRAFDEALQRLRGTYSIAMIDIDHFKKFNDAYGHGAGDEALRFVAKSLLSNAGARVYRYGGEEFSVIFDCACDQTLLAHVDSLRRKLAARPFYIRSPQSVRRKTSKRQRGRKKRPAKSVHFTVSVGVAGNTKKQRKPLDVVKAADRALYRAKSAGRNRVAAG